MSTGRDRLGTPGPEHAAKTVRPANGVPRSTTAAAMLRLQRDAGNLAVASALGKVRAGTAPTVPPALQLQDAGSDPGSARAPQLGAVWRAQVVVPLARAADRVGRAAPDFRGARSDLEDALRTIATFRDATPTTDPNRLRYEIIERRARGVLEIVHQKLGGGRSDRQLDRDTIKIRLEATDLGPKLEHRPGPEAAKHIGGGAAAADTDAAAGQPEAGSAPAPAANQAPAAPAAAASNLANAAPGVGEAPAGEAPTTADSGGDSIEDLWNFLVVRRLWAAQRQLDEDPKYAILDYSSARVNILLFLEATPEGHPNRLPLMRLEAGVGVIAGQMASRSTDFATDPLDDQAVAAYETSEAMIEYIPGAATPRTPEQAPAGSAPGGAAGEMQEPKFTWESEQARKPDDTALERP